ncbi:MAG: DUF799 family lipoprotein [Elusimicrobia bacterium]|nr:DUF799 family lipoprotein [Elusimicrobiota bacterium]
MSQNNFLVFVFAVLSGCAYPVAIRHYKVPDRLNAQKLGSLERLYVVAAVRKEQTEEEPSALGQLVKSLRAISEDSQENPAKIAFQWDGADSLDLARQAGKALDGQFCRIAGIQASASDELPVWASKLKAKSSLMIYPETLNLSKASQEREVKDRRGAVVRVKVWTVKIFWKIHYRLFAEPGHELMAEAPFNVQAEESFNNEPDLRAYLEQQKAGLAGAWAGALARDLLPYEVERRRGILKGKTPQSKEAFKLAKKGEWEGAQTRWQEIAKNEPGNAAAHYNLAVAYERRGLWDEAKKSYEAAQKSGKKLERLSDQAIIELGELMPAAPAGAVSGAGQDDFFKERWAVLPFANETVDLDGPSHVRAALEAGLGAMGWPMANPEEVDAKLKSESITDGGQLNALTPQKIGGLLGAEYLIYGNLEEYKTVPLGVYHKVQVRLALRVVEAKTGKELWRQTEEVTRQSVAPPKRAAEAFAVQLAGRQLKKLTKTYLKKEVDEVVLKLLACLPQH